MNLSELLSAIEPIDLKSCLITQSDRMLFEHYRDQNIPVETSKINSCTKSFLSALVCIAMDQGKLPEAHTPITEFFPQLLADPDPRKREITLEHLLTMTAGFEWTEFGGQKSFPRMTRSSDWVDFVLKQPLSVAPGTRMEYNSGVSQLLSAILVQASGMPTARFAEEELFSPLGIEDYKWEADPQGIHTGGYGLWLRPVDMLRFGLLYLQQGRWEQRQLISRKRLNRSVQPAIPACSPNQGFYGWHWWSNTFSEDMIEDHGWSSPSPSFGFFYARGYAGQFIYIIPDLDIVVTLTDDKRKKERHPSNVFRDFIAPLLLKAL
ncbi:serine hydrolase domain-containing protein [Paenibacillus sp. PL91]|uniref:serine hydrolase domain-containing protein n=1 Tax=Paenibacillus sp. PL91 TaxID=2729538 RepID=UPI00145E391A|nr:serine hydrolase [Paenibacillus sp. PL91]MBC9205114.1 serine hydrolase [Paenibacillus sp. PL91]